ncbi:MAG: tetratricopeptide repeat protein [Candidatus Acidiferrales bacterium]
MTRFNRIAALVCAITLLCAPALRAKSETWVEVRGPHFIVISNAGEKEARQTAIRFEQIRTLFRQLLVGAQNAPSPTITIFAVKNEASLRELLPEYWAKGHGHIAGIFFDHFYQFYAAVQLDAPGDNPYATIYHEYYHSLTVPYFPGLPLWLAEGLAEFFGNTQIEDKKAYSGQPDPGLIQMFQQGRLIPLTTLVSVDYTSPYYNEQNKMSEFYAESWALVHYLMMDDNGSHRPMLIAYLAALDHGATSQEAASKAFGDLRRLEGTLQRYAQSDRFYQLVVPVPAKISDVDLTARQLSEAEIDAAKGGFEATRGKMQEAEGLLRDAIRLDPNLALAQQNLAETELFEGKLDDALDPASKAVALDPKNSLTRYLRAYLTLHSGGMVRNPQVEDDLRQSIALSPDFAPSYALLGIYLASNEETLPQAADFVKKAIALEPGNTAFQLDFASVLLRTHRYDDARTIATRARASAHQPQEREQADQLIQTIDQIQSFESRNQPGESGAPAGLPELHHREEQPQTPSETQPSGPPPAARTNAQQVTGTVAKVTCNPAMRLQVTASDGTYDLYTVPGEQTRFEATSQPPAGFNPCSSLKGLRVTIQYDADGAKSRKGKIELLEILGWQSQ